MPPMSVNFSFLSCYDYALVEFAGIAEANAIADPNTSLVKIRQFAEFLVKHVSAYSGLPMEKEEFGVVIKALRARRIIPRDIAEYFDLLRLRGNEAVHDNLRDARVAYQALVTAYELAKWFHGTVTNDLSFSPGPFRPPPSPVSIEREMREELELARDEVTRFKIKINEAEGTIAKLSDAKTRFEEELTAQYEALLKHYMASLRATKANKDDEIKGLQARLAILAANVDVHPQQMVSFINRTGSAAIRLGLSGEDAKFLPIAQLRIKGPKLSKCHSASTLIVQTSTGGMVSANCSKCNKQQTLTRDEFFNLDVWVSCVKCRIRMAPQYVTSNYGFVCPNCNWRCFLASLVPHYSELL
jgi:type I restriction enzyme R subunit